MMVKSITDSQRLIDSLGKLPEPAAKPVLILMSGLPGTGKSSFSSKLAKRLPVITLSSDKLRKTLFKIPDYSEAESTRLFSAIHHVIELLLKKGISIILDATNLVESKRETFYTIASRLDSRLIIIKVTAPPEIVRRRLARREFGIPGGSDADWTVYEKLKPTVETISRDHYIVDTSGDIESALNKITDEILNG